MSFALLVYASAYVNKYYPTAFCVGLLRAQPIGFYSPQSPVADARRHGVIIHGPDINASGTHATLKPNPDSNDSVSLAASVQLHHRPPTRTSHERPALYE